MPLKSTAMEPSLQARDQVDGGLLRSNFISYSVAHSRHSCNMAADGLAPLWASLSLGTDPTFKALWQPSLFLLYGC